MDQSHPRERGENQQQPLPVHLRFLTFSCYHRMPLLNSDAIKDAFVENLLRAKKTTHFRLLAWVIMPDHVHMIIEPNLPDNPVAMVLSDLKGPFGNRILRTWKLRDPQMLKQVTDRRGQPHFWEPDETLDTPITSYEQLDELVNRIHDNPVNRGLVRKPEDWPWSSCRYFGDHQ